MGSEELRWCDPGLRGGGCQSSRGAGRPGGRWDAGKLAGPWFPESPGNPR